MIKKVLDLFIFSCLLAGVLMFSGCSDNEFNPGGSGGGTKEDPSTLDFATSQTVKLLLNYDVTKGVVSTFDIYAEYPFTSKDSLRKDIVPIGGGIYVSGVSEITRVIPSHVEKLYIYSPNLFVPLLSYAEIKDGVASFSQVNIEMGNADAISPKISTRNSPDFWKKEVGKYLKEKEDFYSETTASGYKYDLIAPDMVKKIPDEIITAIGQAFPEKVKADPKYLKDASIELKEAAEVFVTPLHCGAAYNSSFSYVVYEGPKELNDLTESEKMELEVINILQYADVHTNTFKTKKLGLTPGHYVQLLYKKGEEYVKEFPAGAKIGWILHSNGFSETNFAVNSSYRVFSPPNWNDANDSSTGELLRTIYFAARDNAGNLYNCFGFEDQKRYDDDCNDLIFQVQSNPVTAIEPPEIINPSEEIEKTESVYGILAFEDKWPKRDDYDLNDVVVSYNSAITYVKKASDADEDATVKKVEDIFSFTHTGAAYNNAFSYKVNISKSKLKSVKIEGPDYSTPEYNVIEDGSGFIIDLCANVAKVIRPFTSGDTAVYTVVMEFAEGTVLQKDFASIAAPYNPFITPKEAPKPKTEIHLPMYPPTNRGDMSLFGTGDDCSDAMTGLWYVSGVDNQYPFAIHLAGATSFKIPRESSGIDISYPYYKSWVESNMTENKDWYLFPGNY